MRYRKRRGEKKLRGWEKKWLAAMLSDPRRVAQIYDRLEFCVGAWPPPVRHVASIPGIVVSKEETA
jgi:hypothetical protein